MVLYPNKVSIPLIKRKKIDRIRDLISKLTPEAPIRDVPRPKVSILRKIAVDLQKRKVKKRIP